MPTVAMIGSIAVVFYVDDHDPPHFHLRSPDFHGKMSLEDLSILQINGKLVASDLARVRRWARKHHAELFENWLRARRHQPLVRIEE